MFAKTISEVLFWVALASILLVAGVIIGDYYILSAHGACTERGDDPGELDGFHRPALRSGDRHGRGQGAGRGTWRNRLWGRLYRVVCRGSQAN